MLLLKQSPIAEGATSVNRTHAHINSLGRYRPWARRHPRLLHPRPIRVDAGDVIGGFNSFVTTLRSQAGLAACTISATRFDNVVEHFWQRIPLDDVPAMDATHFAPRGSTALLDAVGETLTSIEDNPDDRFLAIIHTDGHENASREWTVEKIRVLISSLKARGNWSFAFFGADTDAWTAAEAYGMNRKDAMVYAKSRTRDAYSANARVVSNWKTDRTMRSSEGFGEATQAVHDNPDLTDEEIARILKEE